ncbi:hypothetical protein ACR34G_00050 [Mycoplasma sp. 480]|uniref:hypothetical protein n=1 Tax=Mycoplasma sp. 480 TaxID=3440155 RepID=UPI003F510D16
MNRIEKKIIKFIVIDTNFLIKDEIRIEKNIKLLEEEDLSKEVEPSLEEYLEHANKLFRNLEAQPLTLEELEEHIDFISRLTHTNLDNDLHSKNKEELLTITNLILAGDRETLFKILKLKEIKSYTQTDYDFYKNYAENIKLREEKEKLLELIEKLKTAKKTLSIFTGVLAGTSALSFALASFGFVGTLPIAIAGSVGATASASIVAGIKLALVKYEEEMANIKKATYSLSSIYTLGHSISNILKPILIASGATISASTYWFPAAFNAVLSITSILSLLF